MNRPEQVFQELWHERLAGSEDSGYIPGQNQRVDAAVRLLCRGERLLDVGCGSGILGLAARSKFDQIFGIDLAQEAVEAARTHGVIAHRVDLSSESLPFESEYFDSLTFLSALPYIYDPYHALRECQRVLRKNGMLILSSANMRTVGKLFSIAVRGRFPCTSKSVDVGYDGGAMHYFCSRNLVDLLHATGFRVITCQGIFYRPRVMGTLGPLPMIGRFVAEFFGGEVLLEAQRK